MSKYEENTCNVGSFFSQTTLFSKNGRKYSFLKFYYQRIHSKRYAVVKTAKSNVLAPVFERDSENCLLLNLPDRYDPIFDSLVLIQHAVLIL